MTKNRTNTPYYVYFEWRDKVLFKGEYSECVAYIMDSIHPNLWNMDDSPIHLINNESGRSASVVFP